ncbi:MAG: hypothetical protein DDT41_01605 [candidate division WS2 bacterium]|nr:hypothetical protein [Candidatus Psychracetigena formicireducens]
MPGWYGQMAASTAVVSGDIYYIPIFVSELTTYIRIAIEVMTAAAGACDLRIFNWSGGLPSSLVLSAGTVDTGTIGVKEIVISRALTRGYYFLAHRTNAAPSLRGIDASAHFAPVPGMTPGAFYLDGRFIIPRVTAVYADPAPAPTSSALMSFAMVALREN